MIAAKKPPPAAPVRAPPGSRTEPDESTKTLSSLRIAAVALALTTAAPVLPQEALEDEAAVEGGHNGFDSGWLGLVGLLGLAGLRGRQDDHTVTVR